MLRRTAVLVVAAACAAAAVGPAAAEPLAPVPRGSKLRGDRHVSAVGFAATADWYARRWRKDGLVVRTVGPYRVGGVEVVRYLRDDAGPWRAVHVYRLAGVTWISVVPAASAPPPLDDGGSTE